jgi:hypothetical protein
MKQKPCQNMGFIETGFLWIGTLLGLISAKAVSSLFSLIAGQHLPESPCMPGPRDWLCYIGFCRGKGPLCLSNLSFCPSSHWSASLARAVTKECHFVLRRSDVVCKRPRPRGRGIIDCVGANSFPFVQDWWARDDEYVGTSHMSIL